MLTEHEMPKLTAILGRWLQANESLRYYISIFYRTNLFEL